MKKYILALVVALFSIVSFSVFADSIFDTTSTPVIPYCETGNCSLEKGVEVVKGTVDGIEKNRTFSQYIQDVIKYVLTFVTVLAVLYVMYAGFKIFTSTGNEEGIKKGKNTIVYVLVGIVIIWLAYPIVKWIIDLVTNS